MRSSSVRSTAPKYGGYARKMYSTSRGETLTQGSSSDLKQVTGVFDIPYADKKKSTEADSEESDDEEEEENDAWLDYNDMSGSDDSIRSRVPKTSKVIIRDFRGNTHVAHGKFPLTQVYWQVTANLTASKGFLRSVSYAIRTDDDNVRNNNLIMIFLTDCLQILKDDKTESAVKACFDAFCRLSGARDSLSFTSLEKTLNDYMKMEYSKGCCLGKMPPGGFGNHQQEDHSKFIKKFVLGSGHGTVVLRAASHPVLVKTLSELLPNHFVQFLHSLEKKGSYCSPSTDSEDEDDQEMDESNEEDGETSVTAPTMNYFVQLADEMARERPWEFCFRDIIYSKFRIPGIEATLVNYERARYMLRTPQTEKDAIYIYEVLKVDSKKDGHTYMGIRKMQKYYLFRNLGHRIDGEQRWQNALDYLERNSVIKRETFNCEENIFLRYNWQAEVDTAKGMGEILKKQETKPLKWTINFKSPDFASLRQDPDQLKALHLISNLPITVMSGRGGCGKTTVVTKLLKHLCDLKEKEIKEKKEREEMVRLKAESTKDSGKHGNIAGTNVNEDPAIQSKVPPQPLCSEQYLHDQAGPSVPYQPSSSQTALSGQAAGRRRRIWVVPDQPDSKEEKLRKEVVSDLIKIVEQSKVVDDLELREFKQKILLTAPTGKAARLLGTKASLPSATLHSVIMSWRMHLKRLHEADGLEGKKWTYADVEIWVVDECSLVSIRLFAAVFNILLKNAALQKVILLGDVRQLPSIEAGDFLRHKCLAASQNEDYVTRLETVISGSEGDRGYPDVFRTLGRVNQQQFSFSIELTNNHRSESELIVENAGMISKQTMPTFDRNRRFHLVEISETDDNARDEAVQRLLTEAADLASHVESQFVSFRNKDCRALNELCCRHYNRHPTQTSSHGKRKAHTDFQIGDKVCLKKNSQVVNQRKRIINRYAPDYQEFRDALQKGRERQDEKLNQENKERKGVVYPNSRAADLSRSVLDTTSAVDLISGDDNVFDQTVSEMKERDERVLEAKREREKQERLRRAKAQQANFKTKTAIRATEESLIGADKEKLCNGEVFFIMDEMQDNDQSEGQHKRERKKPEKYLVLSDRDPDLPRVVCVPLKVLRGECKMMHSWARTIHTYQGSESSTVVYVVGKAGYQNWQHVYTAVTRGKKSVYIVGNWAEIHKAIMKREYPRNSRLSHRLEEMLMEHKDPIEMCKEDCLKSYEADLCQHDQGGPWSPSNIDDKFLDSDDSWLRNLDESQIQILDAIPEVEENLDEEAQIMQQMYSQECDAETDSDEYPAIVDNYRYENVAYIERQEGAAESPGQNSLDCSQRHETQNYRFECRLPTFFGAHDGVTIVVDQHEDGMNELGDETQPPSDDESNSAHPDGDVNVVDDEDGHNVHNAVADVGDDAIVVSSDEEESIFSSSQSKRNNASLRFTSLQDAGASRNSSNQVHQHAHKLPEYHDSNLNNNKGVPIDLSSAPLDLSITTVNLSSAPVDLSITGIDLSTVPVSQSTTASSYIHSSPPMGAHSAHEQYGMYTPSKRLTLKSKGRSLDRKASSEENPLNHTPVKRKHDGSPVNTPFREQFTHSLSMSNENEESDDSCFALSRKSVQRKLSNL